MILSSNFEEQKKICGIYSKTWESISIYEQDILHNHFKFYFHISLRRAKLNHLKIESECLTHIKAYHVRELVVVTDDGMEITTFYKY